MILFVGVFSFATSELKNINRTNNLSNMLSLESKLISVLINENNFSQISLKLALQDGNILPETILKDLENEDFITLPPSATKEHQIKPGISFFDDSMNLCEGWDRPGCLYKVEISLQIIGGKINPKVSAPPEWLSPPASLANTSPFALWAFAYRITANPDRIPNLKPLGTPTSSKLKIHDHQFPLSQNRYIFIGGKLECDPGGIISGIDSQRGVANCIYPVNKCSGRLAKQIVISNGEIGVECAEWKSISCPPNYVFYEFNPQLLDADQSSSKGAGRCVYYGRDLGTIVSSAPATVTADCPKKYIMSGACSVLSETSTNCTDGLGNILAPAKGSVNFFGQGQSGICQTSQASPVCPPGYNGGSWNPVVEINGTCNIDPLVKFVDIIVGQ